MAGVDDTQMARLRRLPCQAAHDRQGGIVQPLCAAISGWYLAGLDGATPRGLAAAALAARLPTDLPVLCRAASVVAALSAARREARRGDRIVAFGSFFVAAEVLAHLPALDAG